jgi:hypothetical protein
MYTNTYHIPILALSVCPCSDGRIRVTGGFVAFHNEAARPEDEASQPAAHAASSPMHAAQPSQPTSRPARTACDEANHTQPPSPNGLKAKLTLILSHAHTHTPTHRPPIRPLRRRRAASPADPRRSERRPRLHRHGHPCTGTSCIQPYRKGLSSPALSCRVPSPSACLPSEVP